MPWKRSGHPATSVCSMRTWWSPEPTKQASPISGTRRRAQVEICRGLRPIAERLGARIQLRPEELYALYEYYVLFSRFLQKTGEGTSEERIELGRKGLEFARRRAALDPADVVAQFAVGDMLDRLAREYESVDPNRDGPVDSGSDRALCAASRRGRSQSLAQGLPVRRRPIRNTLLPAHAPTRRSVEVSSPRERGNESGAVPETGSPTLAGSHSTPGIVVDRDGGLGRKAEFRDRVVEGSRTARPRRACAQPAMTG